MALTLFRVPFFQIIDGAPKSDEVLAGHAEHTVTVITKYATNNISSMAMIDTPVMAAAFIRKTNGATAILRQKFSLKLVWG